MAIFTIVRSLWKKRKVYSISVFLMMILVSLLLFSSLSIFFEGQNSLEKAYIAVNSPDILLVLRQENVDEKITSSISNRDDIDKTRTSSVVLLTAKDVRVNGKILGFEGFADIYNPDIYNYKLENNNQIELEEGEILAPVLFQADYNAQVGDVLEIDINGENNTYRIADFFEDPVWGSNMIAFSNILFCKKDLEKIKVDYGHIITMFSIYTNEQKSDMDVRTNIFNAFPVLQEQIVISTTKSITFQAALMIPMTVASIFIVFSILCIIVMIFVIRHAIHSAIEVDFAMLGVLKAVGFTHGQIILAVLWQYVILTVTGTFIGMVAGFFVIPVLGTPIFQLSGLIMSKRPSILLAFITLVALILFSISTIWILSAKTRKISPVRALRQGTAPVYFRSRLNIPLQSLSYFSINLRIAIKQFLSRFKRYISLIFISLLLTFTIILMSGIVAVFADARQSMRQMGFRWSHIEIAIIPSAFSSGKFESPKNMKEYVDTIVTEIESEYPVEKVSRQDFVDLKVENQMILVNICESYLPEEILPPVRGRHPVYKNEISLGTALAALIDKDIGDSVMVEDHKGNQKEYLVSAVVQTANNMGMFASLPFSAWQELDAENDLMRRNFIFKEDEKADEYFREIEKQYESDLLEVSSIKEQADGILNPVNSILQSMTLILYIITFFVIGLITALLVIIAIYRESMDLSIFKSQGYTTGQLRKQFLFRFTIVSLIGGALGVITAVLFGETAASAVFAIMELARFSPELTPASVSIPFLFVVLITILFSWLASGKVKKISPRILIRE